MIQIMLISFGPSEHCLSLVSLELRILMVSSLAFDYFLIRQISFYTSRGGSAWRGDGGGCVQVVEGVGKI